MATAAARRYAKAAFELASEEGQVEQWSTRLARISALFADPQMAAVLRNPTIPSERRQALVSTPPHIFDQQGTNLARLLIESGRVQEAGAIEEEFQLLANQAAGRVPATVTTAIELTAADRDRIAERLSKQLDKDVRLTVVVDPRVIGGLKLQYGDRVVDATVTARLQQLRRLLAAT